MKTIYSEALSAFLDSSDGMKQGDLALRVGCPQGAISRYVAGKRFPDVERASAIDAATEGRVSLSLWRVVAAERAGLTAATRAA